ncbi:MAG: OsmC family protein [Pseudomonadota bacterium]
MTETQHIRDALERAEKAVTLRPQRGQRIFRNTAQVRRGTRCEVIEQDEQMVIDVPQALGGTGEGPSPSMVLRAAFTSCIAIGIRQWAARLDVPIDTVDVTLETDVDARGQLGVADEITPGFLGLRLQIDIGSDAPLAAIDKIVATSLCYSPLLEVFENPQTVSHQIHVTPNTTTN